MIHLVGRYEYGLLTQLELNGEPVPEAMLPFIRIDTDYRPDPREIDITAPYPSPHEVRVSLGRGGMPVDRVTLRKHAGADPDSHAGPSEADLKVQILELQELLYRANYSIACLLHEAGGEMTVSAHTEIKMLLGTGPPLIVRSDSVDPPGLTYTLKGATK